MARDKTASQLEEYAKGQRSAGVRRNALFLRDWVTRESIDGRGVMSDSLRIRHARRRTTALRLPAHEPRTL